MAVPEGKSFQKPEAETTIIASNLRDTEEPHSIWSVSRGWRNWFQGMFFGLSILGGYIAWETTSYWGAFISLCSQSIIVAATASMILVEVGMIGDWLKSQREEKRQLVRALEKSDDRYKELEAKYDSLKRDVDEIKVNGHAPKESVEQ